MSLGSPVITGRLALRGKLQFRAADGSIIKEVQIVDGSLPITVSEPADPSNVTELPHVAGNP